MISEKRGWIILAASASATLSRGSETGAPSPAQRGGALGLLVHRQEAGEVPLRLTVTTLSERIGLGKIYPHLLRHACATHLHEAGAELSHIRDFLGHSSIASTERYVHVTPTELGRFVREFHPRQSEGSA